MAEKKSITWEERINAGYFLMSCLAACYWPLLRIRCGSRAIGWDCVGAASIMWVYTAATASVAMMWYFALWILMCVLQRLAADKLEQTLWRGFSLIGRGFCNTDEWAKFVEPVILLVLGFGILDGSVALGRFLMIGYLALMIQRRTDMAICQRQMEGMHDAEVQMGGMAEMYREFFKDVKCRK